MKIKKFNENSSNEIYTGCTVSEFIEILNKLPQDAIIQGGNDRYYNNVHKTDTNTSNIFVDQLQHTNKQSDKRVILWGEE